MKRFSQQPLVIWVKRYRKPLAIFIICVSLALLIGYTILHPVIITNVLRTDPRVLILLFILYSLITLTQLVIMLATIRLCGKQLSVKRGVFLSIYSSLINFFGPLQSGPSIRAIYLKAALNLRIRDYVLATLYYYFAFAAINTSLLFITSVPIVTMLGMLASIAITIAGIKRLHLQKLSKFIFIIYAVTLIQVLITTAIYFTELNAIATNTPYNILQTLVYSASANLSMFVSITPGAIGIREAFILFAQSLHHVSLASVIAAGVLDRAFYILFLVLLFVVTSGLHLQNMFSRKKAT